jgi:cobalamin synthase
MCKKNLGGVSGDTAGYYVVMGEASLVAVLSITAMIIL